MKQKPLQHDMFLYEFAVRMLATLATLLFSLLFFYGAVASDITRKKDTKSNHVNKVSKQTEYTPLGDMH